MPCKLLTITGPTACGKTRRAVELASALNGEIISADSRQVYKGMDIGTGKDLQEYGNIPYHLIDIVPAGHKYNLYEYLRDFHTAFADISARGKLPILCGGTGLYVESVLAGIRLPEVPENPLLRSSLAQVPLQELTEMLARMKTLHNTTDVDTHARAVRAIEIAQYYIDNPHKAADTTPKPMKDAVCVCLEIPRDIRRARITRRLHERLNSGMVDEVRSLIQNGVDPQVLINYGLEYKFITLHILGKISLEEMTLQLETAIHQFAKRQMTWFRGMERRGFHLHYLPFDMPSPQFIDSVKALL